MNLCVSINIFLVYSLLVLFEPAILQSLELHDLPFVENSRELASILQSIEKDKTGEHDIELSKGMRLLILDYSIYHILLIISVSNNFSMQ